MWNLCPDNLEACRAVERDFLPSLENYFEEAIDQLDPKYGFPVSPQANIDISIVLGMRLKTPTRR